jgi:DNA-binding NarL/FixJ family response regulator
LDIGHADVASVAVAAKDARTRTRMAGALAAWPEFGVQTGTSAMQLIRGRGDFDLLALHCDAVDREEVGLFRRLRDKSPDLRIVAVCEVTNSQSARRALDGGADGFVFANRLEVALAPTIAAVLVGQTAVPRDLRAVVRKPSLSSREKQILGMVVMGFTNSEIGARLFLAESTVKSHLSSAFSKLGVRSRSEAAAMILDPHGSLGTGILGITGEEPKAPAT